jgi:hypothetical protein
VLFGVSRDAFASRMLRYTYGIALCSQFDESKPHHVGLDACRYRTIMKDGIPRVHVDNIFYRFAQVWLCKGFSFVALSSRDIGY